MHELSDDARSILDLVRDVDDPTDRDKKRVTGAMIAQIGAAAAVSSSATMAAASGGAGTVAAATGVSLATKVLTSVAVVGLVTGGAMWQRTSSVTPPVRESAAVVTRAAQVERAAPIAEAAPTSLVEEPPAESSPAETPPAETLPAETPPRAAPRSHAPAAQGALALEVSVLGSARSALRAGEPLRALALLDANRATFARGMLREEYLAARVMALRDLGRRDDAAAAAAQFAAEMPHSPLAAELASRAEGEARP